MKAPLPSNEAIRLELLEELGLLNTPPEDVFDDLALLAAHICGAPIALMSIVEAERQWFKARVGLEAAETHRDSSFCAHAILSPREILVVNDATRDKRFADNPLVLGDPQIRFYAGAPLVTNDGIALGTLCVIDRRPRRLKPEQLAALRALSRSVVAELETRRSGQALRKLVVDLDKTRGELAAARDRLEEAVQERTSELAAAYASLQAELGARSRSEAALRASEAQLRDLLENTHDMVQSVTPDGRYLFVNSVWRRVLGYEDRDLARLTMFDVIHPDSLPHCREVFARVMKGEAVSGVRAQFQCRDGRKIEVEGTATARLINGQVAATHGFFRDITERMEAEHSLRASEEFNRIVLATLGAHIAVLDRHGTILAVNEAWRQFGLENDAPSLGSVGVGRNYLEVCQTSIRDGDRSALEILAGIESVLSGRQADFAVEYPCHCQTEQRWFYMRVRPLPKTRGGAVISHENVTERKLAELALRQTELRLQLAAEASHVGFWEWEIATDEVFFSAEWKRQLGYQPQEIANHYQEWESRLHPEDREKTLRLVSGLLEKRAADYSVEFRLRHRDGSYRWILARARAIGDGQGPVQRLLGCHVDISHLKLAEERLRHEIDLSNASMASLPGIFYVFSADGKFWRWNRHMEIATGYSSAEIGAMHPLDFFNPQDRDYISRQMAEVFEKGESTAEAGLRSRDGTTRPYFLTGRKLELEGKTFLVGMGLDISERKQAEEQLHELTGRLLLSQDEERRRIARELHDTTSQKIAGLAMNLSVLKSDLAQPKERVLNLLEDSQELVEESSKEIRTLSYLLHPPLLDELGLSGAVRDFADGFARRSGIEVTLQIDPDLGRLPAHQETALFRILQESLANVHRHSGSPGAQVRLRREPGQVTLRVKDSGRGMNNSSPSAQARRTASLGVGIAGMRERVRQLSGRLEIQSGPAGTTVTAVLPLEKTL